MPATYTPSSDLLSYAGRAGHDIALAGLLGGQLFGRVALHPAVTEVSDARERGAVVNRAWRRYGVINGVGLLAVTAGWVGARLGEAGDDKLTARERRLAHIKDALVAATFAAGAANAIEGVRFAQTEPNGAVPLADGDHAAPTATAQETKLKRRLNRLSVVAIGAELGLVAVNAALAQSGFRRAPAKRLLRRGR
jgi:uncharacterized membrane protein